MLVGASKQVLCHLLTVTAAAVLLGSEVSSRASLLTPCPGRCGPECPASW